MDNTFKQHPDLSEYFETSDGEKFYKADLAKNHVRTFALKDVTIKTVLRPEETEEKLTAAEIIALVPEMDQEKVTEHLDSENALPKKRKSVIEALTNRSAQLQSINSATKSAAEFKKENTDVNVIDKAGNVLGDEKAGAPFVPAENNTGNLEVKK